MSSQVYDVVIVGAGIAGSSLAFALSQISSPRNLSILLLERNLAEPQRIVGELLQPGGVEALKTLGLSSTLENIGAIPVKGYGVSHGGKNVRIPYPGTYEGRSFHHGRFVQALRRKALEKTQVQTIEATVTDLIECPHTSRVLGVVARPKAHDKDVTFLADLTVVADGCFSNLRSKVMTDIMSYAATKSHFVGVVLNDAQLPYPKHGTVALIPGSGPVLLYQIEEHDTRILLDIKDPLPKDLKSHIEAHILPHLPLTLHLPVKIALSNQRLQRMPNTFLPPRLQCRPRFKEGSILLGDAWNMRHPLTGGGMTVALTDVVLITRLLTKHISNSPLPRPLTDWDAVSDILYDWHWQRKPLASTINILSVALYDLFGADDEDLEVLRTGCFKYFELGGECVNGPVSLLSGIKADPVLLFFHFFAVAFYSIWVLFTHPRPAPSHGLDEKMMMKRASLYEYPVLVFRSFSVFWTACVVFGPLLWSEIRWW